MSSIIGTENIGWFDRAWKDTKRFLSATVQYIPICTAVTMASLPVFIALNLSSSNWMESDLDTAPLSFSQPTSLEVLPNLAISAVAGLVGGVGFNLIFPKKPLPIETEITDQPNFRHVKPGAVFALARSEITEVVIGQYLIGVKKTWQHVTHVGIVNEIPENNTAQVYHMQPGPPGSEEGLTEEKYTIYPKKQYLFFHFMDLLPQSEKDSFNRLFLNIAQQFTKRLPHKQDNYNSVSTVLFSFSSFQENDWISLLNDLIEYKILVEDISYIPERRKYFCSEFVLNVAQITRLLNYPCVSKQLEKICGIWNVKDSTQRKFAVKAIYQELNKTKALTTIASDPFFFTPANRITPGRLLEFAERHQLPVSRVSGPDQSSAIPSVV